jgi:hypothetical protein
MKWPGAHGVTPVPSSLIDVHYLWNSCTHLIQIWQVKFEFGYGPMNFERVIPLELRKKNIEIFS